MFNSVIRRYKPGWARARPLGFRKPAMRSTLAITVGILIAGLGSAKAQNNQLNEQWCAYFTGGPTNCGFASFEQCLQAIRGKTGLCDRNPQYVPPDSDQRRHRSHRNERP